MFFNFEPNPYSEVLKQRNESFALIYSEPTRRVHFLRAVQFYPFESPLSYQSQIFVIKFFVDINLFSLLGPVVCGLKSSHVMSRGMYRIMLRTK